MVNTLVKLSIAILLAGVVFYLLPQDGDIKIGLAILTLVAILWMTETFHISITALLIPLLAIFSGLFDVKQALVNFAHPVIWLFMGGFALASALHKQQLDRYIADSILRLARGHTQMAIWMIFITTAFVSMWISNTATAAMMLPLALGLLSKLGYQEHRNSYWFVLLGIAYSANVGGIGTLVGSPPNAIAAANAQISFVEWLGYGLPAVIIMLPMLWAILYWRYRPCLDTCFVVEEKLPALTGNQKLTLLVFAITVAGWLFSKPLSVWLGVPAYFDAVVAMLAIIQLAVLRLIAWDDFQQGVNWGVLILFGGGLTLSALLQTTGSSAYLGELILQGLQQAPLLLLLMVLTLFVIMLTEVAGNTASSALLIPIFISVAASFNIAPEMIAIMIAIAASCAFMLPVATPPNAIVFGSGLLPQQQMMKTGLILNLLMTLVISIATWLLV